MSRWKFLMPSGGCPSDVNSLSQNFPGDIDIHHWAEDDSPGEYFFLSRHLESLTEPHLVKARGERLLSVLNGIRNLSVRYYSPIFLAELLDNDSPVYGDFPTAVRVETFDSALPSIEAYDPCAKLINLSRNSHHLREALFLLGQEQNWVNLYKIIELIESDWGKENIVTLFGSNAQYRQFGTSANHPAVSGSDARHSIQVGEPSTYMPLEEAEYKVHSCCRAWVRDKYDIQFPDIDRRQIALDHPGEWDKIWKRYDSSP